MRRPTPYSQMFRWWNAALADGQARGGRHRIPITEDDPQPGFYRRRLVRLGPWIEAKIWIVRDIDPLTGELADDERLMCEVGDERRDPFREWVSLASTPITKEQFEALRKLRREDPRMAATLVRFDLATVPMRP